MSNSTATNNWIRLLSILYL